MTYNDCVEWVIKPYCTKPYHTPAYILYVCRIPFTGNGDFTVV